MKKAIIILSVLAVIGVAIYFLSKKCACMKSATGGTKCGCSKTDTATLTAERKAIVDEILEKGVSTPEQEITFESLALMTLEDLKALLTKVKEDYFIAQNQ